MTERSEREREPESLVPALRPRHVSMIAFGGIIGAGLFVGSSTSIIAAGPAVVVSYALAGLLILLVMRIIGELASLHPTAGSFTSLVRIGLGDQAGFICAWLYWYFWVIVVPIELIAGATILQLWLPLPVWLIGGGLLSVMTAINLLSTRIYGELEFWLSLTKVAAIIAFILMAIFWASGAGTSRGSTFSNYISHGGFAPHGWLAVLSTVTSVIFALCGAEIATIAAAESKDPARALARITLSVSYRILLFYIGSISLVVAVVPWNRVIAGRSPFVSALHEMGVPAAELIMNVVVLVAVMSCVNSALFVTSRVMFSLALTGDAPSGLVILNKRGVPQRAILIASFIAYIGLGASIASPTYVFSFLVNASGATMLIIYGLVCAARIKTAEQADCPSQSKFRVGQLGAVMALLSIGAVLIAMALDATSQKELYSSLVLALVVSLFAFIPRGTFSPWVGRGRSGE